MSKNYEKFKSKYDLETHYEPTEESHKIQNYDNFILDLRKYKEKSDNIKASVFTTLPYFLILISIAIFSFSSIIEIILKRQIFTIEFKQLTFFIPPLTFIIMISNFITERKKIRKYLYPLLKSYQLKKDGILDQREVTLAYILNKYPSADILAIHNCKNRINREFNSIGVTTASLKENFTVSQFLKTVDEIEEALNKNLQNLPTFE